MHGTPRRQCVHPLASVSGGVASESDGAPNQNNRLPCLLARGQHRGDRDRVMRIVLISLERATERRRRMAEEFARVGLDYEIWPAKDARALTDEDRAFVDRAARERLGLYPIPDGSLANTLSQRAVMRDLVRNGPDMMAVFEDDARFDSDLRPVLEELHRCSDMFDIVKMQRRNLRRPFIPTAKLDTGHRLGRVRFADFGSDGYVITRVAARLLIERTPRMIREIDHVLSRFWESGLNVLYLDPPVVREDRAHTSQIHETRNAVRLAHRRERRRRPTILIRRLTATITNDVKRRIAFRHLLQSDHAASRARAIASRSGPASVTSTDQAAPGNREQYVDD